ncbi:MAG: hypothetical protein AB9866_22335 [Syntrophobacteraceae bacterium]
MAKNTMHILLLLEGSEIEQLQDRDNRQPVRHAFFSAGYTCQILLT